MNWPVFYPINCWLMLIIIDILHVKCTKKKQTHVRACTTFSEIVKKNVSTLRKVYYSSPIERSGVCNSNIFVVTRRVIFGMRAKTKHSFLYVLISTVRSWYYFSKKTHPKMAQITFETIEGKNECYMRRTKIFSQENDCVFCPPHDSNCPQTKHFTIMITCHTVHSFIYIRSFIPMILLRTKAM